MSYSTRLIPLPRVGTTIRIEVAAKANGELDLQTKQMSVVIYVREHGSEEEKHCERNGEFQQCNARRTFFVPPQYLDKHNSQYGELGARGTGLRVRGHALDGRGNRG